jgi:two-component system sensor histidine kinase DegS
MERDSEPVEIQAFFQELQNDHERVQMEINEVSMLIRQSAAEVERLAQRTAQITTRVRQMEAAIETYPRDAIRQLYLAAQESEIRLISMRGQVEQLQAKQEKMQQYVQLLQRVLEVKGFVQPQDESRGAASDTLAIARIIEAQEEERLRLARQMHDGPTQSVSNLILQTEICERLFQSNPEQARLELANLRNAAGSTFQRIREFIAELRPMMLDDLGLIATARRYLQDVGEKSGLAITFTPTGTGRRLASYVEITLFRAIQQLVARARDEARATRVEVSLDVEGDAASLVVQDDGVPLDFQSDAPAQKKQAEYLEMLRQRVEMLGGKIEVSSAGEVGTVVRLQIPVES